MLAEKVTQRPRPGIRFRLLEVIACDDGRYVRQGEQSARLQIVADQPDSSEALETLRTARDLRAAKGDKRLMASLVVECGMIEDTHLDTRLSEYHLPSGELAAVCMTDWLGDGGSAVYSFFDPKLSKRSPGTWMILDLIDGARRRGLAHVYLGYWIDNAPKMAYKEQFRPLEGLGPEGWRVIAP